MFYRAVSYTHLDVYKRQPFATAAMKKVSGLNIAIDVAEIWDEYSYEEKGVANTLPMGCIVVRKDFLDEYEKEFSKFLDEYDYFKMCIRDRLSILPRTGIIA